MSAHHDPGDAEAEVFRAFGLACRAERDRISLADIAEHDRRFEHSAADREVVELFAARLIALISRP